MQQSSQLKALILGSTGAVGQELLNDLLASPKWSEVHVIVRRELEEWKSLPENQRNKLKITKVDSLDELKETNKFLGFSQVNSFFCVLGTRNVTDKQLFQLVDYDYPVAGADIALANKIPHYLLLTGQGVDAKSSMHMYRIKGEVENTIAAKHFAQLSVFRPGLITDRGKETRWYEKLGKFIPFISKISANTLARSMVRKGEMIIEQNAGNQVTFIEHKDITKLLK